MITNPNDNYELFENVLLYAKNRHLKKYLQFCKKKHKKTRWITDDIHKSINTKEE